MFKWVSHQPYRHHQKWRVWFRGLDGQKCHRTFDTEDAAFDFIKKARSKLLPAGGHPIGESVSRYIDSRKASLRPSSLQTLDFRTRTIIKGRDTVAVEIFPWTRAWNEHVAKQSVDSQPGILAAVRGFCDWCMKAGFLRRDPLAALEIQGRKKRGKEQLHIDETGLYVQEASSSEIPWP